MKLARRRSKWNGRNSASGAGTEGPAAIRRRIFSIGVIGGGAIALAGPLAGCATQRTGYPAAASKSKELMTKPLQDLTLRDLLVLGMLREKWKHPLNPNLSEAELEQAFEEVNAFLGHMDSKRPRRA